MIMSYFVYPLYLFGILLILPEQIPCIHLVGHIVQAAVIAVGDDGLAHGLEAANVINNQTAEEGLAVLQRRLVDDHTRPWP